jgi:hypothetical protein
MQTFKQFLEVKGDALQMRQLGLTHGFRSRKPSSVMNQPTEDDIMTSKYLVMNAPASAPDTIKALNGQVVANAEIDGYHGHYAGEIWIYPLTGKNAEGLSKRVPISWVYPATEDEEKHGQWLGNTFFYRDKYTQNDERNDFLNISNAKDEQIIQKAMQALYRINPALADGFKNNQLSKRGWGMAADALEENDYDTTELRALLGK